MKKMKKKVKLNNISLFFINFFKLNLDFGNILIDKEDSKLILSRFNQDEISLNRFHQDEMRYYFDGYSQEESSFNQDEIRQNVCYYIKEGATFNQDENCEKDFSFKNEGSGIFEG